MAIQGDRQLVSVSPAQTRFEESLRRERKADMTCEHCGKGYAGRSGSRFCGRACSAAARRLGARLCEVCGDEFQPRWGVQKYCSPTCRTAAMKAAASRPRPNRRVDRPIRACATCGKNFRMEPGCKERYCSRECWRKNPPKATEEGKRRQRKAMQNRKGRANPNFKHGQRSGVRDRAGEERWYAVFAGACQNPDCPGESGPLALHHVVYRQRVQRAGGDRWDPRNALTLCGSCHTSHHRRGRVLDVSALRQSNIQFALELMGERATGYFQRYYRAPSGWTLEKEYDHSVEAAR
jgi:hypothetical protein